MLRSCMLINVLFIYVMHLISTLHYYRQTHARARQSVLFYLFLLFHLNIRSLAENVFKRVQITSYKCLCWLWKPIWGTYKFTVSYQWAGVKYKGVLNEADGMVQQKDLYGFSAAIIEIPKTFSLFSPWHQDFNIKSKCTLLFISSRTESVSLVI